ncbi:hypothetical protein ZEAMMB73_Zm00001d029722 [Zea mays]|uniref:Uncharacterized protein n=1 Tax=Zea mays TaxID=4577 RepID=A0A1D6K7E8_MAIZE|nr:hypothetical protein ZEAMMB73_Zm00001d029722 [Zea mays]
MTGAGAGGGTRITGVEPRWWWTPSLVSYRVVEIEIVGVHNSQWRTVLLSLHPPALPPCYINARRFCLSLSLRRLPPPHPSPLLGAAPRRAASSASPPRSPTTRPAPTSSRCSQSPPATPPLTPRIPDAESCPSPAAVSSVFSKFRDPAPSPVTPDDAAAAPDEPRDLGFDDDDSFDADSILCGVHQSAAEGIDGIMGKGAPSPRHAPWPLPTLVVITEGAATSQRMSVAIPLEQSITPLFNAATTTSLQLYFPSHVFSTEGGAGGENFSQFGADLSRRMTYCHRAKDDSTGLQRESWGRFPASIYVLISTTTATTSTVAKQSEPCGGEPPQEVPRRVPYLRRRYRVIDGPLHRYLAQGATPPSLAPSLFLAPI